MVIKFIDLPDKMKPVPKTKNSKWQTLLS